MHSLGEGVTDDILFARDGSLQAFIERLLGAAAASVEAAIYRLNNPSLARALEEAYQRGAQVRLVLDRNKFEEDRVTRRLLSEVSFPVRLLCGREGRGSKMHHKFALIDSSLAVTGSYNWTLESEKENFENLLVLRARKQLERFRDEFEALWKEAVEFANPDQARPARGPEKTH
jgi:phosphatidylserine/phosphatidylglycerophosphate/cardiolipin synthase-like enzyme